MTSYYTVRLYRSRGGSMRAVTRSWLMLSTLVHATPTYGTVWIYRVQNTPLRPYRSSATAYAARLSRSSALVCATVHVYKYYDTTYLLSLSLRFDSCIPQVQVLVQVPLWLSLVSLSLSTRLCS
jgi:hypothetical protein